MDAAPLMFDFSCANAAEPATNATVTLSGGVTRVELDFTVTPPVAFNDVSGASLKACKVGASTCSGQNQYGNTATSMPDGTWSIGPITTGGTHVDAFVSMTATNSRETFVYPAFPFTSDQANIPVLTFTPEVILALDNFGCPQNDNTNGMIGLAVTDCADMPVSDTAYLDIMIKQNGAAVTTADVVDLGDLRAEAAGTYLICNVPENATTEVSATYNGMAFKAHNVKVVKGTTTATIVRPGY